MRRLLRLGTILFLPLIPAWSLGCTALLGSFSVEPGEDASVPLDATRDGQTPAQETAPPPDGSLAERAETGSTARTEPPVFSPPPGTYTSTIQVSMASDTPGATIWFTLDGQAPSPDVSTRYARPIAISASTEIRAVAVAKGLLPSEEQSASYQLSVCLGKVCGGVCVDTSRDQANCGECDRSCSAAQTCMGGECVCKGGKTACANAPLGCADITNSADHCGACDKACTGGTICSQKACVCPSGMTDCGGTCVSLATNADNCGTCGRSCAGLPCTSGLCGSEVVCEFPSVPTNATSSYMTVHDGTIYFASNVQNARGYVMACADSPGGAATLVATNELSVKQMASGAANGVFWTAHTGGTVRRYVPGSTTPTDALSGFILPFGLAHDGTTLYVGTADAVVRSSPTSTSTIPWISGLSSARYLTAFGPSVYALDWGEVLSDGVTYRTGSGRIVSCPRASACAAEPTAVAAGLEQPVAFDVSDEGIFFATQATVTNKTEGAVYACPAAGCTSSPNFVSTARSPGLVHLSKTRVYWSEVNIIRSCPLAGCQSDNDRRDAVTGQVTGMYPVFVVHGDFLYFAFKNRLFRTAK